MKTKIATLVLGLVALGGAAAAQNAAQNAQRLPASETTDTSSDLSANTVTVQNDRKVPVTIYMEYGQFDRRLGVVPALQTTTFSLPAWAVKDRDHIELFAHPQGSGVDLETQEIALRPPGRIGMIVAPRGGLRHAPRDTMMQVLPPEELADATLTVDNPRSKPVTVFADMDPFDVRLGVVPAHSRVTLRFPKSVVSPDESITIFVEPENGVALGSQTMEVKPGEHLGLRVPLH